MAMKVIEVNTGEKIPYTVSKTKVTFDDELTLNLAKLERDFDVSVDICIDRFGMLVTGLGVKYAAQIEIPARKYTDKDTDNPDYDPEDGDSLKTITVQEPVTFSMDNVTLKLYAID
jgi:hypothetical protein